MSGMGFVNLVRFFGSMRVGIVGLSLAGLGLLSACIETPYIEYTDGSRPSLTAQQDPNQGYRTVMTPSGLRIISPTGELIDPNQAPETVDVAQLEPIGPSIIAVLVPLTGPLSSIGEAMKNGADLAIKQKGLQGTFETRIYDTQSNTAGAQAAATKALNDGASFILGPLRGDAIQPVARLAARKRVNVVSFGNDITRAGGNGYVMGITPEAATKRVLSYAIQRGNRRIAVVAPSDTYGQAAAEAAVGLAGFLGGQIILNESYPADPNDRAGRTSVAQRIGQQAAGFDAIFIPDTAEAGDMASLLYFYGVNPQRIKYLGVPIWDQQANDLISEQALLGAIYASPAERGFNAFLSAYKGAFAAEPHPLSSVAYDGVAMALEIASSSADPRFDAQDIERPQGYSGIDGPFAFRSDKRVERGMAIKRISSLGLEVVEDAPTTLYSNRSVAPTSAVGGSVVSPGTTASQSTVTYTTTTTQQTQTYRPAEPGGWIGTGENRVWVPANG